MRLFVAVRVPEGLRGKAASLASELPQDAITRVKPENMHLTLKFIGEVDEKARSEIMNRLSKIRFAPIDCTLKGVGAFPDEHYVRVVWAGVESNGALEALAKGIIDALAGFGKDEGDKFTAHLTVVRVRRKIDAAPFLKAHKDDLFGEFRITSFELMESELRGAQGPLYKIVESFEAKA